MAEVEMVVQRESGKSCPGAEGVFCCGAKELMDARLGSQRNAYSIRRPIKTKAETMGESKYGNLSEARNTGKGKDMAVGKVPH